MTKKHFKAIAEIIKENATKEKVAARLTCADVAYDLCRYFQQENPRFDREKFLKACGL